LNPEIFLFSLVLFELNNSLGNLRDKIQA